MSDYVRALRQKIGTDLLFMPSVAAVIRDEDNRILLVQHVEGRWQLPGGAVDPGERPAEAMQRECREEAGIDDETQNVGWFHPAEIDSLEHSPASREVLRSVLAGTSFV